jgi:hypothetical protein
VKFQARPGSDSIRLEHRGDVRYWAGLWGLTDQQLRDAVAIAGPIASEVASYLGQPIAGNNNAAVTVADFQARRAEDRRD